jgi:hypothetical protein
MPHYPCHFSVRIFAGRLSDVEIGNWLRSLGLAQYEPAFRENAIDGEVLPKLTSEDLKEIGVVAIGHRRKLLEAIAALGAEAPAAATPSLALPRSRGREGWGPMPSAGSSQ